MRTDTIPELIQKMLTTTPPAFSRADAERIGYSHYGIRSRAKPQVSERDQNFRLDAEDGRRYMLKISNAAERQEVIDFQNGALQHVAQRDKTLPLPRVISDREGQLHCHIEDDGKTHFVRVLSWLEGAVLEDTATDAELAGNMGQLLAKLGLALSDFDHAGSNPALPWDMKRASGLRELLPSIEDAQLLKLIGATLDTFDSAILPAMGTLRTQVIHNDMNPGNVLVDATRPAQISGLIDFGDLVKSPLITDLAVAAAYQLSQGEDPLAGALPLIAGYHAIRPLQRIEMELLTDLIRTRLVTSLLIGSHRVKLFPENRDYLMVSFNSARGFIIALERLDADAAFRRIQEVCPAG